MFTDPSPDTVEIERVDFDDLRSTLARQGLEHMLDAQLSRPLLGHPMFAQEREYCRANWIAEQIPVRDQSRRAA